MTKRAVLSFHLLCSGFLCSSVSVREELLLRNIDSHSEA